MHNVNLTHLMKIVNLFFKKEKNIFLYYVSVPFYDIFLHTS